jgi:hypothetical protein
VFRKALALLDHPWLMRYGNLRNLISVAGGAVVVLAAVIVGLANLLTSVGPVPLVFLGIALVIFGLVGVQKLQERQMRPRADGSSLWSAVYGEREKERERRAKQIAKEIVDREERG